MSRRNLFPCLLLTALTLAPRARAQSQTTPGGLFKQGRDLMEQHKYAEACRLFAEGHRLDPKANGILLNLAECMKLLGRTATAWNLYNDSEFAFKREHDEDRAAYAHQQATALEPKLSKLRINATDTPGLTIRRDDEEVGKPLWGIAVPADPGEHKIEATAPGYLVWTTTVKIGLEGDLRTVEIPALSKSGPQVVKPASQVEARPAEAPAPAWGARRTAGVVIGGVGIASVIAGAIAGGLAMKKGSDSKASCAPDLTWCYPDGYALQNDGRTLANVSNATLAIGGAAVVAGVVLFLTAPRGGAQPKANAAWMSLGPTAGAGEGGVVLLGGF